MENDSKPQFSEPYDAELTVELPGYGSAKVPCQVTKHWRSAESDDVYAVVKISGLDLLDVHTQREKYNVGIEPNPDGLDGFRQLANDFPEWNIRVNAP